jgi:hypothetical protein
MKEVATEVATEVASEEVCDPQWFSTCSGRSGYFFSPFSKVSLKEGYRENKGGESGLWGPREGDK